MTRLSHSALEKLKQCPFKWKSHYQERVRPDILSSPLFFGSALDEAFGRLLLEKKDNKTEEELTMMEKTALQIFHDALSTVQHNGESIEVMGSLKARYSKADMQTELLNVPVDCILIEGKSVELGLEVTRDERVPSESFEKNFIEKVNMFLDECRHIMKVHGKLEQEEAQLYNYIAYLCLFQKGKMLLEAYEQDIMPTIHKVHSIQGKVDLKDEDDSIIGYIDFEAEFVGEEGVVYVCDNKTSSRKYTDDSVATSPQLATYCEFRNTNKAAYVVVEKGIRKREPRTRTQVIKDTIPEQTFEEAFEDYDTGFKMVESDEFPKAYESEGGDKNCYAFGRKCEYWDYCRSGSMDGLVKLDNPEQR